MGTNQRGAPPEPCIFSPFSVAMGTKGRWAYRFNKRYYIKWNQFDSYPNGLGRKLVAKIPTDPQQFAEWKAAIEDMLLKIDGEPTNDDVDGYLLSFYPPMCDWFAEWTYVIDLDRNSFTINSKIHFKLDNIPRAEETSWSNLFDDDKYYYYWLDTLRPYLLDITAPQPEINPDHIEIYRNSCVKISDSVTEILDINPPHIGLGKIMIYGFIQGHRFPLAHFHQYSSGDYPFQQIAFGMLSLMCSGGHRLVHRMGIWDELPAWDCPPAGRYWLANGIWIHLVTRLDSAESIQSAIGEIIKKAREEKLGIGSPFIAVVFSIRHVVIVTVQQCGEEILHTNVLEGMDDKMVFEDLDNKFPRGFLALLHLLGPKNMPYPTSLPKSPACLPIELLHPIFEFADTKSRIAWSQSSKLLRQISLERPLFGRFMLKKHLGGAKFLAIEGGRETEVEVVYHEGPLRFTETLVPMLASSPLVIGSFYCPGFPPMME